VGVSRALKALKHPGKTRNIIWDPALLLIARAAGTYRLALIGMSGDN